MNILTKLSALVLVAGLAACEHTSPVQQPPEPVDAVPPTTTGATSTPPAASPQAQAPQASQQQAQTVMTLHLAQAQPDADLIEVNAGGDAPLYALPQPVLTQGDIGRVSPVQTQGQGSYLLLEMNQHGIPKLHSITQQARGHYLLLSVQGQLVSVAQIGETITDGRLLVSTQGPEHAQAVLRMMRGG